MPNKESKIKSKNGRTYIVAELSANHGGSIETAKETIKVIHEAGADAVKLQTYTPDTITLDCDNEYFQITQGTIWDGTTLHKLYQTAYTPWEWHEELYAYARDLGLDIFSSPFDPTAVDLLESLDNPIYKVASFEIMDLPLIKYMAEKGKPMVISTGVATLGEIQEALDTCRAVGNHDITLLKCTSSYPAPYEDMNILTIPNMREIFGVDVGLSDHSMGTTVALGAVALGANFIEKHVILDKSVDSADAAFSMDMEEFKRLVDEIRILELALGEISYDLTEKQISSREHSRSLFVVRDIEAGEEISPDNVRSIRPGYGLAPKYTDEVMGKRAKKKIAKGTPLAWNLFE